MMMVEELEKFVCEMIGHGSLGLMGWPARGIDDLYG